METSLFSRLGCSKNKVKSNISTTNSAHPRRLSQFSAGLSGHRPTRGCVSCRQSVLPQFKPSSISFIKITNPRQPKAAKWSWTGPRQSRGPVQDHLAAKGCLGFVILMKEINDAFNYGNSAAEVGRLRCLCCSQSSNGRCRGRMYYVRAWDVPLCVNSTDRTLASIHRMIYMSIHSLPRKTTRIVHITTPQLS